MTLRQTSNDRGKPGTTEKSRTRAGADKSVKYKYTICHDFTIIDGGAEIIKF